MIADQHRVNCVNFAMGKCSSSVEHERNLWSVICVNFGITTGQEQVRTCST